MPIRHVLLRLIFLRRPDAVFPLAEHSYCIKKIPYLPPHITIYIPRFAPPPPSPPRFPEGEGHVRVNRSITGWLPVPKIWFAWFYVLFSFYKCSIIFTGRFQSTLGSFSHSFSGPLNSCQFKCAIFSASPAVVLLARDK